MQITDVSTHQYPWVMDLFMWKSRTAPLPFSFCLIDNRMITWDGLPDYIGGEKHKHLRSDVHCNHDVARQDDENQSIVADSDLESVRRSYLYSQRCSKWVSSTINANFVRPDWANSQALNVLLGPLLDVAGYAFAAAAVLAPFSGFNIVTGIEKSKGGEEFFSEKNGELTRNRKDWLFVD